MIKSTLTEIERDVILTASYFYYGGRKPDWSAFRCINEALQAHKVNEVNLGRIFELRTHLETGQY